MSYWWCERCKEELPGAKVTYQERCEDCGSNVEWFDLEVSPSERIAELESLAQELATALIRTLPNMFRLEELLAEQALVNFEKVLLQGLIKECEDVLKRAKEAFGDGKIHTGR